MKEKKTKKEKKINSYSRWLTLFTICMLVFSPLTKAQVTIGLGEEPVAGSLLQLKSKENVIGDAINAHQGLVLPRVALSDKNQLYPMFLNDPSNPASGANTNYTGNKTALDLAHTGMIVYNITEDNDKDLCLGLNQWNGAEWVCFESKIGKAQFGTVACSDIAIHGSYIEGAAINSSNFLRIKLNVTKIGSFSISATTGNGYSFFLSNVALNLGVMTVDIPCQGTPSKVQTDNLLFDGIELASGCQPTITVVSSVAKYSLNCSSVAVRGTYLKGTHVNSSNEFIELNVSVSESGSYSIETPLTNGIKFSTTGVFPSAGIYTIKLLGDGIPTQNFDFPVAIKANTPEGNDNCSAKIPITLPAMTYFIIGNNIDYSWTNTSRRTALTQGSSFGPNGIVKMAGFSEFSSPVNTPTAAIAALQGVKKPDVILFFSYGFNTSGTEGSNFISLLNDYINKGGCVIYGATDNDADDVNRIMSGVFGMSSSAIHQSGGQGADDVYPILNLSSDPVINGPFGNLASKHWGEDNTSSASIILQQLPPNSVQVCTARSASKISQNPDYSIVWYNESKNFFYFGDSVGAAIANTSTGSWPSSYTSNGSPLSKSYGPGGSWNQFVYNSALELNAVAWAIKKAAVAGINTY